MTRRPGPILGQRRRRPTASPWLPRLGVVAVLALGGWMWATEIGADLADDAVAPVAAQTAAPASDGASPPPSGAARAVAGVDAARGVAQRSPVAQLPAVARMADAARLADAAPTAARPTASPTHAAGPAEVGVPRPERDRDPVVRALLATARDHVARGVRATSGSVPDLRAIKGSSADLIERALAQLEFPLRAALQAHRAREPRRYGLSHRPSLEADPRRVLDVSNLVAFLETYAEHVPQHLDQDLHPGDLLVVQGRRGGSMIAVVSDATDVRGVTLLYTLDPRDGVALASHGSDAYALRGHYRLDRARLEAARRALGLSRPVRGAAG